MRDPCARASHFVWVTTFTLLAAGCGGLVRVDPDSLDAASRSEASASDAGRIPDGRAHESGTGGSTPDAPPDMATDAMPDATTDTGPVDETVLATTTNVLSMALTSDEVLWTDGPGSGSIFAIKKTGGPRRVLAEKMAWPDALTVSGSDLYFAAGLDELGSIRRMPTAGGTPVELVTNQRHPTAIVVVADHLYWVNGWGSSGGALMRAKLDGSNVTTLVSGLTEALHLLVTKTHAYWGEGSSWGGQVLRRYDLVTGVTETLLSSEFVRHFAKQEDSLYVLHGPTSKANEVFRMPIVTGSRTLLATEASDGLYPGCLVTDSTHVYFHFYGSGLLRIPLAGGTVGVVAPKTGNITAMAIDELRVFWGEQGTETKVRAVLKSTIAPSGP